MGEDDNRDMGIYGSKREMGENPIVVFGPGTIPMDRTTVVCANLPNDHLYICFAMTYCISPIGLPHGGFLRVSQPIPLTVVPIP